MSAPQKERVKIVKEHYGYLVGQIQKLDDVIVGLAEPFASATVVEQTSAIILLSEIGADMSQFDSSKRLCCWAGLTPGNNESAGKKKSVRINRAGVYMKPALVETLTSLSNPKHLLVQNQVRTN